MVTNTRVFQLIVGCGQTQAYALNITEGFIISAVGLICVF